MKSEHIPVSLETRASVLECGGCPSSVAALRRVERGTGLTLLSQRDSSMSLKLRLLKAVCVFIPHAPHSKTLARLPCWMLNVFHSGVSAPEVNQRPFSQ